MFDLIPHIEKWLVVPLDPISYITHFVLSQWQSPSQVGYIYAYKAGWPVSVAQIVQAAVLAVILIFVGYLLYKEAITWNKIVGIIVCLAGLGLINMK